jgi:hypothetical protein
MAYRFIRLSKRVMAMKKPRREPWLLCLVLLYFQGSELSGVILAGFCVVS